MASLAIKIPQPLGSDEIKNGIASRVADSIPSCSEELRNAIRLSLNKTCSLNRQSYSKFSAKWNVTISGHSVEWKIEYDLDDFGRSTPGVIIGRYGSPIPTDAKSQTIEGFISPTPPDRFRRETQQPVPEPQVVKKKQDDGMGISLAQRSERRRREV
jgi:hypothetical protein